MNISLDKTYNSNPWISGSHPIPCASLFDSTLFSSKLAQSSFRYLKNLFFTIALMLVNHLQVVASCPQKQSYNGHLIHLNSGLKTIKNLFIVHSWHCLVEGLNGNALKIILHFMSKLIFFFFSSQMFFSMIILINT